jgi:hypothetical protein
VFEKLSKVPHAPGPQRLNAQLNVLLSEVTSTVSSRSMLDMITFALPPVGTELARVHAITFHQIMGALHSAAQREVDNFILSLPVEALHREMGNAGNAAAELQHLQEIAKAVVEALKLWSQVNVIIPEDGSTLTALIKQYAVAAKIDISS